MPELREWLATTRVDLALIQEPFCYGGRTEGLGLNAVIVEGLGDEGKLAVIAVLNKNLKVKKILFPDTNAQVRRSHRCS